VREKTHLMPNTKANSKVPQHTATHCNTLQHTAAHLMHMKKKQTAKYYNTLQDTEDTARLLMVIKKANNKVL